MRVVVQDVGHRLERLGGGEGPGLSAPPAAVFLQEEHRVVSFGGGRAEGRLEILRIHEELPRGFLARVWQVEGPGDVPVEFAPVGAAGELPALVGQGVRLDDVAFLVGFLARGHREKELPFRIPQLLLHEGFQGGCLFAVAGGFVGIACHLGDFGEGVQVGPHVGIERGAEGVVAAVDVFGLAAVDVELHAVGVSGLPEHAHLIDPLPPPPGLVVFLEVGKKVDEEGLIRMDVIDGDGAVGEPR